jgi:hypothetical protein
MELAITRGGMLKLRDARDLVVEVRKGALWITEEGDSRDYYVAKGDWLRLDCEGLAIAHALEKSVVTISRAARANDEPLWSRVRRAILQPLAEVA